MPVVHDLVAHIDGRAEALERLLDDLDRALDARAKPPGLSQEHAQTQAWSWSSGMTTTFQGDYDGAEDASDQ